MRLPVSDQTLVVKLEGAMLACSVVIPFNFNAATRAIYVVHGDVVILPGLIVIDFYVTSASNDITFLNFDLSAQLRNRHRPS